MNEIEVKAKLKYFDSVVNKLKELGCELSEPIVQKDRIFLHKDTDCENFKEGDIILRIRDAKWEISVYIKKTAF